MFGFSLDKHPEVPVLGQKAVLVFIFRGPSGLFSVVAAPVCDPASRARGAPFHRHLDTDGVLVFDDSRSNRREGMARRGFNLHPSDDERS